MEKVVPGLSAAEWVFWHKRARSGRGDPNWDAREEQLQKLRVLEHRGYRSDEVAIKDEFQEPYAGKVYGGSSPGTSWELLTMGMQDLVTGDQHSFVWKDDDYRRWLFGVLAGV
jgi:hypothetical protein